jgi:hypothetical protein
MRFAPCPSCTVHILDKRAPLPALEYQEPCSCGKRFIDDVFSHLYVIMVEEGDLARDAPLIAVGSPLIHPGSVMDRPPFLPEKSLLLLSAVASPQAARRIMAEVPEVRGVVRSGGFVPGIYRHDLTCPAKTYDCLAGCDVRADVFPIGKVKLVIYRPQSRIHIEFPRAGYAKLQSVLAHVGDPPAPFFVDACSGPGTLGLAAALRGVGHVILNDAWYWSAYWAAVNIEVNREYFDIDHVRFTGPPPGPGQPLMGTKPVKIAETKGRQKIEVYFGNFQNLSGVIPNGSRPVAALDIFEKDNHETARAVIRSWRAAFGGDAFIP